MGINKRKMQRSESISVRHIVSDFGKKDESFKDFEIYSIYLCEKMTTQRVYVKKSLVPIEEDEINEFKGHRSIGIEDLPPWCFQPNSNRRTRKPASRTLNAFLNSGRGGTIYLGIIDEGVVKGFFLTEYQKDHIIVAIKDLFSRYQPKVEEDKYEIEFVPVVERDGKGNYSVVKEPCDEIESVDKHLTPHLLRTYDFCWCDKDLARRIDENDRPQDYVVEIKISKQKTTFDVFNDGSFKAALPITYQNEEGMCFFRTSASCKEYTLKACQELAIQQLRDLYEPVISSMREELASLYALTNESEAVKENGMRNELSLTDNTSKGIKVCKEIKDYLETTGLILNESKKEEIDTELEKSEDENLINNVCKELGIVLEEDQLFKTKHNVDKKRSVVCESIIK